MPFGIFKEGEHPRGPGGKFVSKGGGGSNPSMGGVKKSDFQNQKFYSDPSKNGWEKRAVQNASKISNAQALAIAKMMQNPADYANGKHDWLFAEGTENTDPQASKQATNAPKPQRAAVTPSTETRTNTQPKQKTAPQKPVAKKTTQSRAYEAQNRKEESLKAKQELLKAKHKLSAMKAAEESQKMHPSKAKLKRLQAQQQKLGNQAKALQAQELQNKANKAKLAYKNASQPQKNKAKLAYNSAQQKAIGAKLQAEQRKKHPNPFAVSRLSHESAKLAKQAKNLEKRESKNAVKQAKQNLNEAKRAKWQSLRNKFR